MPRVISVNNHRFPGPNQYYAGPTAFEPGSFVISGWVSPSPGILISPYPDSTPINSPSSMYRYNLVTNTTTTIPVIDIRPAYNYTSRERPAYASLGGGYTQSLRILDNIDGTGTVNSWIWNDATLSWSVGASLTIPSYNQNKSNGLYALSLNRTFFEHGTQAWIYNRLSNTWSAVATPMPREVWAAAKISEGLLYLAGKKDESSAGANTYTAQSAQSFIFDASSNSFANLGHAVELKIPPTRDFGGVRAVQTRSGQMQQFTTSGVIGIGANNNWIIYRHDLGILSSRPRTQTPDNIQLLRPDPITYVLNIETGTDYVYSW